jgi:hypothetical protein
MTGDRLRQLQLPSVNNATRSTPSAACPRLLIDDLDANAEPH